MLSFKFSVFDDIVYDSLSMGYRIAVELCNAV